MATVAVERDAADRRPACVRMPRSAPKSCTSRCAKYGWTSIWFTAGKIAARPRSVSTCATMKLLTPIARTLPSASRLSRAR